MEIIYFLLLNFYMPFSYEVKREMLSDLEFISWYSGTVISTINFKIFHF